MTKWMRHPVTEAVIELPDAAVDGHRLSGWRETDPPSPPAVLTDDTEPEVEPGAKYAAAVESRPENQSAEDGKEK
jgi:hypothetical protein